MSQFEKLHFGFAILTVLIVTTVSAHSQSSELKSEDVTAIGGKLPSYFPNLKDLSAYQSRLPTHQQITIQWDSMNGVVKTMTKEEARKHSNTASRFTLVKQAKGQVGSPGRLDAALDDGRLLIVGRSASGEIRCMETTFDPRASHAEFFNNKTPERYDYVNPIVTIDVAFCDDPDITTLDFVQLDQLLTAQKTFNRLGSLTLARKPLPVRKASSAQ